MTERNYERMLVHIARAMFDYINSTNSIEELQRVNDSKVLDALLEDWDNHEWKYPIDYIDDFTMNLGEWLVLKIDMLRPSKRENREGTGVPPGVVEKFAEDVQRVLKPLEKELGIFAS